MDAPQASQPTARWKKLILRGLLIFLAIDVLGLFILTGCTGHWLPQAINHAPNTYNQIDPSADPSPESLAQHGVDRAIRVPVGPPDASIYAWILEPQTNAPSTSPKGTILIFHGIQDRGTEQLPVAQALAKAGFRAVLPDLRGHGRSSGTNVSYGIFDARDMTQLLDDLEKEGIIEPQSPIGTAGFSYGAAVSLRLAATDPRIKAVVTVSTFTRMRDIVPLYVRKYVPLGRLISDQTIQQAVTQAGELGGYNPDDADSAKLMKKITAPVLLFHGINDKHIPVTHGQALFDSGDPERNELILIDGAEHFTIFADYFEDRIMPQMLDWFGRHL